MNTRTPSNLHQILIMPPDMRSEQDNERATVLSRQWLSEKEEVPKGEEDRRSIDDPRLRYLYITLRPYPKLRHLQAIARSRCRNADEMEVVNDFIESRLEKDVALYNHQKAANFGADNQRFWGYIQSRLRYSCSTWNKDQAKREGKEILTDPADFSTPI
ncbi:hypothetical protein IH992_24030 [Candidatus Poribacteria bacterium]|nr:hypothetical protein [Candidatus Poribacteria bacterium]